MEINNLLKAITDADVNFDERTGVLGPDRYIDRWASVFTKFRLVRFMTFEKFVADPKQYWEYSTSRGDFWRDNNK